MKSLLIGLFSLGVGAVLASQIAFGHSGGVSEATGRSFFNPERHEIVEKAIELGDYRLWEEMMPERAGVRDFVNEQNFDRFAQMHEFMEEGEYEKAEEIMEELGMPHHGRFEKGRASMMMR